MHFQNSDLHIAVNLEADIKLCFSVQETLSLMQTLNVISKNAELVLWVVLHVRALEIGYV